MVITQLLFYFFLLFLFFCRFPSVFAWRFPIFGGFVLFYFQRPKHFMDYEGICFSILGYSLPFFTRVIVSAISLVCFAYELPNGVHCVISRFSLCDRFPKFPNFCRMLYGLDCTIHGFPITGLSVGSVHAV